MKLLKAILVIAALGILAGCIVVPAHSPGYYGGGHAYYGHSNGGWRGRDRD